MHFFLCDMSPRHIVTCEMASDTSLQLLRCDCERLRHDTRLDVYTMPYKLPRHGRSVSLRLEARCLGIRQCCEVPSNCKKSCNGI